MADRNLRIRMLLEAGNKVSGPLREIAGGSVKAAQALKSTRDELKGIEKAQADIGSFRSLKAGLRSTEQQLGTAQAKVRELAAAMRETDNPSKVLVREFERAKREAAQLGTQFEQDGHRLQQLRDRLRAAGVETSALARHERDLRERAAGANREIAEQERRVSRLADRERRMSAARERFGRMQGIATGMAASGAASIGSGVAIGTGLWRGVAAAQQFESAMTDTGQKANLTRVETMKLGRELLVAAKAANQLPEDLQQGVDTLAGFGKTPQEAARMMVPIGRAATAYKADIADLSAAAFAASDNLKVPIEQTGLVIDAMAQAGKQGAFEIKDMAGSFPALTAGYQALGQKGVGAVADLAAALQIARKGAGDSATAANNVANIIQKISSPNTIKAFDKMGVDLPKALKRAYAEGKTPLEAIAELTAKATGGDLGKIGFLFEDAQVQQGLRPLIQNMEEYRRIRAAAGKAGGTTDVDFAERLKDSAEQTKALKINAQALAITLGTQLLPTVNAGVQKLTAFATWVGNVAQRHPQLTKAVLVGAAALSVLLVGFGALTIGIAAVMGPIAILNSGLIAMGVAGGTASVGLFPIIGTVLLIVAAIAALAAGAYLIYANWGKIAGFFTGLWAGVKAAFWSGISAIKGLLPNFAFIGRMMMEGLLSMLNPARLIRHIWNMGLGAIRAFKAVLGIHSPSRVFAGLGGFMMEGLHDGIAAGERAPLDRTTGIARRLTSAMAIGTIAASPAGAAGAGAGRAAGSGAATPAPGRVYNITINALPGQANADLARMVADEIDRREREARSRQLSAFGDRPDWEEVA